MVSGRALRGPARGISNTTWLFSYYFLLVCMIYILLENIRTFQNFKFVIVKIYF